MRLESFSVENYRSITQARSIPLSSSTVLIGPNNEGKSNILRALSVAMEALRQYRPVAGSTTGVIRNIRSRNLGSQDDKIYDRKRDLPISLQRSKSSKQTKITLEFSLNADEIIEFKEIVKSNLNGTLPVCITFGDGIYDVNIVKPGRGSVTLNAKNNRIASFQADRIQFQYIPAVRTARTAAAVVEDIVANELRDLENDPAFQEALTAIRTLQRPVLNAFSERVTETLKAFVPGIRAVNFSVNDEDKFGVNLDLHPPRNRKAKWSARMGDSFAQAGRPFDDNTKARVKYAVADAVAGSPRNAIAAHAKGLILSLVENLERKLRPFDDADRRPEFLGAVTTKLEAAGPAVIGPGALHRTARTVLRDFWNPPPDLRQGRVGPRGELTSA